MQYKKKYFFYVAIAALALISLGIRVLVQPYPIFNAEHDDLLLVELANNIEKSGWLGQWQLNSLSKGPGYSIFLAMTRALPWAPTVSIHTLLLLAFFTFTLQLHKIGISKFYCLISFGLLAFSPVWFGWNMSRIYRDGLLSALTAWLVVVVIEIVFRNSIYNNALQRRWTRIIPLLFVAGVITGFYVITKVNWQFLLIFFAGSSAIVVIDKIRKNKKWIRSLIGGLLIFSVGLVIPIAPVLYKNARSYGVFVIEDFSSGAFQTAISQIMRVKDSNKPEYVDVTNFMRGEIYAVSPSMAELRTYLEGAPNTGWRTQSCQSMGICNESGLWFPWELRDAVKLAGHANSAEDFQAFLSKVSIEISQACDARKIDCGSAGIAPALGALDQISPRLVVDALGFGLTEIIDMTPGNYQRPPSSPPTASNKTIWDEAIFSYGSQIPDSVTYNRGGFNIEGALRLLDEIYKRVWPLLLFAAAITLFLRGKVRARSEYVLKSLSFILFCSALVFVAQLALLEANSGLFLYSGGIVYLIPVFPMFLMATSVALARYFPEGVENTLTTPFSKYGQTVKSQQR